MSPPTEKASAAQEYRAARTTAAVADLSGWTILRLHGSDTRAFLQGLATQDLENPVEGALFSLFLSEKGRPVALGWVSVAPDGKSAWVLADESAGGSLRAHFERFRVMEDVEFEGPEGLPRAIGVVGPERAALLRELAASMPGSTSFTGDPISFLLAPAGAPGAGPSHGQSQPGTRTQPLAPAAFEAWRIAIGIPRAGVDFDSERIATELSLPAAISMTKGCYVGQEVVSRTSNRGQVRRRRAGFRFAWSGSPIPARTEIRAGSAVAGYVTSSVREPETDSGLGMGYVTTDAVGEGADLTVGAGAGSTHLTILDWPL